MVVGRKGFRLALTCSSGEGKCRLHNQPTCTHIRQCQRTEPDKPRGGSEGLPRSKRRAPRFDSLSVCHPHKRADQLGYAINGDGCSERAFAHACVHLDVRQGRADCTYETAIGQVGQAEGKKLTRKGFSVSCHFKVGLCVSLHGQSPASLPCAAAAIQHASAAATDGMATQAPLGGRPASGRLHSSLRGAVL